MSIFEKKIKDGEISQPIHKTFSLKKWNSEFAAISNKTGRDEMLYNAGIWIFQRLDRIRKEAMKIQFTTSKEKQIRIHIGYINRTYQVVRERTKVSNNIKENTIICEQLVQAKISGNTTGIDLNPDALLTTCIDGSRFPLVAALVSGDSSAKLLDLTADNILNNEQNIMMLGQYYSYLEDAWKEILWNNYIFEESNNFIRIRPCGDVYSQARSVSDYRKQALMIQNISSTINHWKTKLTSYQKQQLSKSPVASIIGCGKKRRIKVDMKNTLSDSPPYTLIARILWHEEYLEDILETDLPLLESVTLKMLLDSWEIMGSVVKRLAENFPNDTSVFALGSLYVYAPSITKKEAEDILQSTINCSKNIAKSIIKFLTFDPNSESELWSNPFISIDDKLYPLVSPLLHGNLVRNVEIWMKLGGLDLSERGYLFESQARKEINNSIKSSTILKNATCNDKSIKLGPNKEEIDIVIAIGNKLLIGEAKCTTYATEAMDYYHFFNTLKYASEQANRKTEIAKEHLNELISKIYGTAYLKDCEFELYPFILTNLTLGVGFCIDDVPVHDLLTLTKYIAEPKWEKMVMFSPDGSKTVGETIEFYTNQEEAVNNLATYLKNIPQIDFYKPFLKVEHFPHIRFNEDEKQAISSCIVVELPVPNFYSDD